MCAVQMVEGSMGFANSEVKSEVRDFSKEPFRRFAGFAGFRFRILLFESAVTMRYVHSANRKNRRCIAYKEACPGCFANIKKKDMYGCNVFVYPTDAQGNLVELGKEAKLPAGIYFWKFNAEKYVKIREIVSQWGDPATRDYLIITMDETFQKLDITPCREALVTTNPVLASLLETKRQTDCYPADKVTAKEVTAALMIEELGLDPRLLVHCQQVNSQHPITVTPATAVMPTAVPQAFSVSQPTPPQPTPPQPTPPQPTQVVPAVQQSEPLFWMVTDKNEVVKVNKETVQNEINRRGEEVTVQDVENSKGWKKSNEMGFMPPGKGLIQSVGSKTLPSTSFDALFDGLK